MSVGPIAANQELRLKSVIRRGAVGAALAFFAAMGAALACGFGFPAFLLDNRQASLLGLKPEDWLTAHITDLMPHPTDDLKAVEQESVTTDSVERGDVEQSLAPKLAAMRGTNDGATAYSAGEGLPEAVRLYIAGAVEFQAAAGALAAD